jgi:hypothetical protein
MAGTVWVFLVAAGFGFLWLVPHVGPPWAKAAAVRAGHLALLGAGTVGAAGWLGTWFERLLTTVVQAVGASSAAVVGTSAVVGVLALGLCVAWVLGILPYRLIRFDPPDWLAWAGLILPAIAVQIPGPAGDAVASLITWTGELVVGVGRTAVGA